MREWTQEVCRAEPQFRKRRLRIVRPGLSEAP
jgi:hypothetical protein